MTQLIAPCKQKLQRAPWPSHPGCTHVVSCTHVACRTHVVCRLLCQTLIVPPCPPPPPFHLHSTACCGSKPNPDIQYNLVDKSISLYNTKIILLEAVTNIEGGKERTTLRKKKESNDLKCYIFNASVGFLLNGCMHAGFGVDGQLGKYNTSSIGLFPNSMGENLTPVNLGTGRSAIALSCGATHTCAGIAILLLLPSLLLFFSMLLLLLLLLSILLFSDCLCNCYYCISRFY